MKTQGISSKEISQREIHKIDLSGKSTSVSLQMDRLLSDLREQYNDIVIAFNGEKHEEAAKRISMMGEYIRGFRDGNRFAKPNPLEE